MSTLGRDLVFAGRTLRKNPAFALTAIITIALGLGACTAIFSVVNAVLLRALPYAHAEQLVHVWPDLRNRNVIDFQHPPGDLFDLRHQTTAFDGLAGANTNFGRVPVSGPGGDPELVPSTGVTPDFFRVMGARVIRGRDFTDEDAQRRPPPPPGVDPSTVPPLPAKIILSNEFWQRRFGGRDEVVGQTITFGNGPAEIVGVLQPGFELLFPPNVNVERTPGVWTALRLDFRGASRANVSLRIVGRLKSDVTKEQAQAQVDTVAADLRRRFAVKESAGLQFRLESMYDDLVVDVRPAILVLMSAVTFVLLIACANVANLLLVRAAARERELAVRVALGGGRWRLVRQLLAESLVIAGAGVLLGMALAEAGLAVLKEMGPPTLPRLQTVSIDPLVLVFAAATGVVASTVFGVLPALRASRPDVMDVLRTGSRTAGLAGGRTLRNAVVIAEVALSLVLLIGAGLMVRSFVALTRVNPGYDPDNALTFTLNNVQAPGPEARAAFARTTLERLKAIPGVEGVTAASPLPLDGGTASGRWGTEEARSNPTTFRQGTMHFVLPGYFEAVETPLIEGRTFAEDDNREDREVIVIDDRVAALAFPNQSAVGKRLLARIRTDEPVSYEVIGVVRHQRHLSLAGPSREAIFFTDGYMGHGVAGRWMVRTAGSPTAMALVIRDEIRNTNPAIIVAELQPWSSLVDRAVAPTRFALFLVTAFGAVAGMLAAVGLYGVVSTSVRQRTAEIGLRMAFGAHASSIFRLVLAQGLRLSAFGIVLGLLGAVAATGLMRTMLVGVGPTDPATFAAISALFLAIAAVACWLPARRASRLDPVSALREE